MSSNPVRVASLGMGWWSDVLADAAAAHARMEAGGHIGKIVLQVAG